MPPIAIPHKGMQSHLLAATEFEVLSGGAAGPGKSWCALVYGLRYVDIPSFRGLILRQSFPELRELMDRAAEMFPHFGGVWNENAKRFTFPSGATIEFGYCETFAHVQRYQGQEYGLIIFDELGNCPELRIWTYLMTRCRSTDPRIRPQMIGTANPGGTGHCVPYGEVLTPQGWRDIKQVREGDPVYTVTPTGALVETRVAQCHRAWHDGEMVDVTTRGFRMVCTPNHSVAKVGGRQGKQRGSKFTLVPFEDLPGQATILRSVSWQGEPLPDFRPAKVQTRARRLVQPESLTGRQFAELLGWFLSEGHTVDRDKAFGISQSKPEPRERLRAFLEDDCGFSVRWSEGGALITAQDWWGYLRRFGKSREKYIPEWVKSGSTDDLRALFDALMEGDGHWQIRGNSGTYYTISKQLADDVAEVALKLGYVVFTSQRERENREGFSYAVNFKRVKSGGTELLTGQHVYEVQTKTQRKSDIKRIPYLGWVYCIGVPETHSFVIRQDGAVWVSGNSWLRRRFIDTCGHDGAIVYTDKATGLKRRFIPGRVTDNPTLITNAPQYVAQLRAQPEMIRRQLLEGDWNAGTGVALDELSWDKHWIEPFDVPEHWKTFGAFDWGFAHPFCFGLFAVNEKGTVYLVESVHGRRLQPHEILDRIKETLGERLPRYAVAGHDVTHDVKARGETGPTIKERFTAGGLPIILANISRITGLNNLRHYLAWKGMGPNGTDGEPKFQIFATPNNRKVMETLESLVCDPDNMEDVLKVNADDSGEGGDDCYDMVRYGLMSRPISSRAPEIDNTPTQHYDRGFQKLIKAKSKTKRRPF